jgi:hypothetical protein
MGAIASNSIQLEDEMSKVISQLDELIDHHDQDHHGVGSNFTDAARAELATLRARIATLEASQLAHEEDCAVLPENVSVTEFVTAQAEALEQARSAILYALESMEMTAFLTENSAGDVCRAWLAANPAQTAAPVICQCCCGCESIATKEDEHGMHVCEGCYNDYYGIAAGRDEVDDLAESELSNDELDEVTP